MQRYIAASGLLLVSLLVHTVAALLCFIQLVDGENSEKINIHYQFSQNADVERYQDIQVNFHFSVSYWLFQSVPCFLHPCTQVKPYKSIVSDERICVFFSQCRLAAAAAEKRKRESLDVRMRHFQGGMLRTHAFNPSNQREFSVWFMSFSNFQQLSETTIHYCVSDKCRFSEILSSLMFGLVAKLFSLKN